MSSPIAHLTTGQRVEHPEYGVGIITWIYRSGAVQVRFPHADRDWEFDPYDLRPA